jgi:hypothetical protein
MSSENIFSQSVSCLLILLTLSQSRKFNFIKFCIQLISFMDCASSQNQEQKIKIFCYFCRDFIFLHFTFRLGIYITSPFVKTLRSVSRVIVLYADVQFF